MARPFPLTGSTNAVSCTADNENLKARRHTRTALEATVLTPASDGHRLCNIRLRKPIGSPGKECASFLGCAGLSASENGMDLWSICVPALWLLMPLLLVLLPASLMLDTRQCQCAVGRRQENQLPAKPRNRTATQNAHQHTRQAAQDIVQLVQGVLGRPDLKKLTENMCCVMNYIKGRQLPTAVRVSGPKIHRPSVARIETLSGSRGTLTRSSDHLPFQAVSFLQPCVRTPPDDSLLSF